MRGLSRVISDFAADPVAAILAFARAGKIACTASDSLGCVHYDFTDANIISIPEWQTRR